MRATRSQISLLGFFQRLIPACLFIFLFSIMNTKTLFFSTIIILGSTTLPALAGGTWVNKKCQKAPAPSPQSVDKFEIDYKFAFTAERKIHWMYAARANDGAYLFCTSRPNYQAARPMNHPKLNFPFVDGITQSEANSPVFSIIIREGNGRNPKIVPTRLDMSNPKQPIVTPE
jgi:hypothetical protein